MLNREKTHVADIPRREISLYEKIFRTLTEQAIIGAAARTLISAELNKRLG
jgi:hypothetical protein